MYGAIFYAQIKPSATKPIGWHFTLDMDNVHNVLKHTAKATQDLLVLEDKKMEFS